MNSTHSRFARTWLAVATLLMVPVALAPVAAQQTATKPAPAKPAASAPAQTTPAPAAPAKSAATLDRTKMPPIGKTPILRVPTWTKTTLANGAELIVSERHELPLVSFSLNILGGSAQDEAAARRGLAGLTAAMLSEGTKTRDGEALSNAMQMLGASVSANIGTESGSLSFVSTSGKFAPMLDLLADMLLNSTFPQDALERLRAQRLVSLTQARSQPGSIARNVFPMTIYGSGHPYGSVVTTETLNAITRDDVVALHRAYFQPGRAVLVVTGDVAAATVKATVEKALAAWPAGGSKPVFAYPALPKPAATTIYLVDKPGAAQSTFAIGLPGPARDTKDYYAIHVMNMMLGGFFQSRLNANIREEKGLSYGVSSSFAFGRGPGAFRAGGDIVSAKSDVALVEFIKELKGIGGARPVTDEELKTAKDALVQSLPERFSSVSSVNASIRTLATDGLPETYYQQFGAAVSAVTTADVTRVARQYVDLDHLAIVIVGDRATIEGPLKATGVAPIVNLDLDGKVVAGK
ncbi:MAG: pitrilysin family protein [Acidobacteriota bacterium]